MSQWFSQPPSWFYNLSRPEQSRALAVYRIKHSDPDTLAKMEQAAKRRKLRRRLG